MTHCQSNPDSDAIFVGVSSDTPTVRRSNTHDFERPKSTTAK
jgi:hypothetical protein